MSGNDDIELCHEKILASVKLRDDTHAQEIEESKEKRRMHKGEESRRKKGRYRAGGKEREEKGR